MHRDVMRSFDGMKRTTVLLTNDVLDVVERMETDEDVLHTVERWADQLGISVGSLRSESSRMVALLRLAAGFVRDEALEESYRRMADWYNAEAAG